MLNASLNKIFPSFTPSILYCPWFRFNIDKDEEKDVFVVDFGLEFDSEELLFLQALEVPNPLCNNFQLPGL